MVSLTDPDSSLVGRQSWGLHPAYYTHYVVDDGRSRVILSSPITPGEVMENMPMLDLLWRARFCWKLHPRSITGDSAYGTVAIVKAVEEA